MQNNEDKNKNTTKEKPKPVDSKIDENLATFIYGSIMIQDITDISNKILVKKSF
jgi:hypothetical protein